MPRRYVITFGCPDRIGIVATIASFLAEAGGTILEAAYHSDQDTGWFFTRQEVAADSLAFGPDELRTRFGSLVEPLGGDWRILDTGERRRMVVLV